MSTAMRATCLALCLAAALMAGCDKSATTASGGGTTTGAPGKPADSGAGKQLVGVWESVEEAKKAEKGEPDDKATVEFKADGGLKIAMGPFEMTGTWKLAKDEGKTLTIDTDVVMKGFGEGKSDKKSFKIVFDDPNTMTMTPTDKPDAKKFKRKT
jgi:hypothetical protein